MDITSKKTYGFPVTMYKAVGKDIAQHQVPNIEALQFHELQGWTVEVPEPSAIAEMAAGAGQASGLSPDQFTMIMKEINDKGTFTAQLVQELREDVQDCLNEFEARLNKLAASVSKEEEPVTTAANTPSEEKLSLRDESMTVTASEIGIGHAEDAGAPADDSAPKEEKKSEG